jgi:hypothetical protein
LIPKHFPAKVCHQKNACCYELARIPIAKPVSGPGSSLRAGFAEDALAVPGMILPERG